LISFLGFLALVLIAYALSSNRRHAKWRPIGIGLLLQFAIGLIVFRLPFSRRIFVELNDLVMAMHGASKLGTSFLLSPSFPQIAGHRISASIISIPAAAVISKIRLPETLIPETIKSMPKEDESTRAAKTRREIFCGV